MILDNVDELFLLHGCAPRRLWATNVTCLKDDNGEWCRTIMTLILNYFLPPVEINHTFLPKFSEFQRCIGDLQAGKGAVANSLDRTVNRGYERHLRKGLKSGGIN
jgi:hypothetical protein